MPAIDVERARAETPGCAVAVHLNNAGSSPAPAPVLEAVTDYLRREALVGGYELAASEAPAIERHRHAVAALLGAGADEVAFSSSDTAAWSTAFWGLHRTGAIAPGSTVLVDRGTYVSHHLALLQAARYGDVRIRIIPSDGTGALDVAALQSMLDERVAAVSLTHVGTHRGLVNPVEEAGAVLAGTGILFLLDACQSVGQLPVDVGAIGCDVLTATGRKFLRAPRGSGLLWVRRELIGRIDPSGIDGHSASWSGPERYELLPDARRFEAFEQSMAVKVGLGVAVDYALAWGIDAISARVTTVAEQLRTRLETVADVTVLDGGQRRCGIVTFAHAVEPADSLQRRLTAAGVNVSLVRPQSALLDGPVQRDEAVRASVHYFTNDDDLDRLLEVVADPGCPRP